MANSNRYRRGIQMPRYFPVDSATVIEVGDMVWLDTNDVKPASDVSAASSGAERAALANAFVGIAMDPSASGETDDIAVDVSPFSIYEMDCTSATFEIGDTVGATGGLLDQSVVAKAATAECVGTVQKRYAGATTLVEVSFASIVIPNNTNAVVG